MTMLSAHPAAMTQGKVSYHFEANKYTVDAPIRRLASISTRRYIVDLLSNRDGIVRADWDYSFHAGTVHSSRPYPLTAVIPLFGK